MNVLDALAIEEIKGDKILLNDGSIATGYAIRKNEEEYLDSDAYISAIENIYKAVSKMPVNTVVQMLDVFEEESFQSDKKVLEEAFEQKKFFKYKKLSFYEGRRMLNHKSYLFINFRDRKTPTGRSIRTTRLGLGNALRKKESNDLHGLLQKNKSYFETFFSNVFDLKALAGDEIVNLLYSYFSLEFQETPQAFPSISSTKEGIKVGAKCVGVVSMISQANKVMSSGYNEFGVTTGYFNPIYQGLDIPHIVVTAMRKEDTQSKLDMALKENTLLSSLSLKGSSQREAERKEADILELESALSRDEESIVSLSQHLIVHDRTFEKLSFRMQQGQNAMSKKGVGTCIETFETLNLFFGCAPACGGQLYKGKAMPLKTAIAYLNLETYRKGSEKGIIALDRRGFPIKYDPFNEELDNQNALVFGPSGSGKSFFNSKMIKDRFEAGHTLLVIDSGGTYRRLFEALGGKYIEYSEENPLALNPFLTKREGMRYLASADKIDFLTSFIGKIYKGDLESNPMTEAEKAILGKYLSLYYVKERKIPTLKGFCIFLRKHKKDAEEKSLFPFTEFFTVMEPFVTGVYALHFNSEEVDYLTDHRLICFELESLKANPKLYPLVIQVLFDFAFEIVANKPNATKFIDVEEGWVMLNDAGEEYIESLFRKGRKTKTSIRLITQDITEVKDSRIAGALKNNASTFILLGNEKASSREEVASWLGLSDHEMQKYSSLRRSNGLKPFREVLIKEMNQSNIFRIETSAHEYAIFTSRPDERNAISELKKTHTLEDAISIWVETNKQKWA